MALELVGSVLVSAAGAQHRGSAGLGSREQSGGGVLA